MYWGTAPPLNTMKMGISASEIMESEEEVKRNLRAGEIPVMHKYRKLDESDQCRVQGNMDALLEKQDGENRKI